MNDRTASVEGSTRATHVPMGAAPHVAPFLFGLYISAMKIHNVPSAPIAPSSGQNQCTSGVVCADPMKLCICGPPTIDQQLPFCTRPALCAAAVRLSRRSLSALKNTSWNSHRLRPSGSG